MAKWAFDDNVPKVRPRLRQGRQAEAVVEGEVTEPPEPRRRSLVRDLIQTAEESAERLEEVAPAEESVSAAPQAPEPVAGPAEVVAETPEAVEEPPAAVEKAPEAVEETPAAVAEAPEAVEETPAAVAEAPQPVEETPAVVTETPEPVEAPPAAVAEAPQPVEEPPPAVAETPEPLKVASRATPDVDAATRRASLRRRAAGLAPLPEPVVAPVEDAGVLASGLLDDLDALESAAELATELERALSEAAEANEKLRRDLGSALDDLARSTAENRRLAERLERLETEARERGKVVQDLVQEMELLEGERDAALAQSADAALEIEAADEKLMLAERRISELERSVADAHARTRRFEEAAQAHAAQRAALRAEVESLRRERDQLLTRNAEIERERDELGRSRKALDEVHRALAEARARAQRIRTR